MKSFNKIIFFLIIIGISCNLVKLYFAQNDLETILEDGVFPWYFKLNTLGCIFISFASIASFVLYRRFFPIYVSICYILLVVFVIFASLNDLGKATKPSFLYSMKGIGTYINIGILFFAADTKYFPKILNFFYYSCFVILLGGIANLGKVGLGAGRNEFLYAIRDFTVYLIWVFPFFFLQENEDKKKNIINIACFLLILVLIISSGSRSYLLLYFVYVAVKFRTQLQSRMGFITILGLIVLAVAGYFIITNSSLNKTFGTALTNLSERSKSDSRSSQLLDFLSQFDTGNLIQGVGPFKQWYWHGYGLYSYLDNQILLIAWWAGLPTIVTYVYFLLRSVALRTEILFFENVKGLKLILCLWIGACLGLAIYVSLTSEAYYFFLSLLMGMNACRYTQLLELDDEEVNR